MTGTGSSVLGRSDWELHHEAPGAVVSVAVKLAGSWDYDRVREALLNMSKAGDGWPQRLAYELANDEERLREVIKELRSGLVVRPELIEDVMRRVNPSAAGPSPP